MREQVFDHSINYLHEQFKILYESIDNLSMGKKAGEKLSNENNLLKEAKFNQAEEI